MNLEERRRETQRRWQALKSAEDADKEDAKIAEKIWLPESDAARDRMAKRHVELERLRREYLEPHGD